MYPTMTRQVEDKAWKVVNFVMIFLVSAFVLCMSVV